ncbi:MAG: hypothetical protein L7T60_02255, partial [Flavobacteriaceae bacterium]|nr:hypothetical protein [Flavobacteriaceae bacterium]
MMKITQLLTNLKLWQSSFVALIFLFSFSINAQGSATNLSLQGIMDFSTPAGGSSGKALHLVASADIADMTAYSVTMYNNGNGVGDEGNTLTLSGSASEGDNILVYRDLAALDAYMDASNIFQVLIDGSVDEVPNGNGDDTVALSFNGEVVDTYGEIGVDGDDGWTGFSMYEDSWAYLVGGEWTAAPENSSDNTETTCDSEYPYPFVVCAEPEADCSFEVFMAAPGSWPSEITWEIQNADGAVVLSGTGSSDTVQVLEMSYGETYTLVMTDDYGDGWNGGEISVNGMIYTVEDG